MIFAKTTCPTGGGDNDKLATRSAIGASVYVKGDHDDGGYQISGYRTFKHVHLRHALVHWQAPFPGLPSYNCFVDWMAEV
jgi:hypothetical protein